MLLLSIVSHVTQEAPKVLLELGTGFMGRHSQITPHNSNFGHFNVLP